MLIPIIKANIFVRVEADPTLCLASQKTPVTLFINPFAPGDFAEKRVLKLVEWFSGHCRAIKS